MPAKPGLLFAVLLCAEASALDISSVKMSGAPGSAKADMTFSGVLEIKGVELKDGAIVMPAETYGGRQYADTRILSKSLYQRMLECLSTGGIKCGGPAPSGKVGMRSGRIRRLRSPYRVAEAEAVFDGELLVSVGIVKSKKRGGEHWVAYPRSFRVIDRKLKHELDNDLIESAVKFLRGVVGKENVRQNH